VAIEPNPVIRVHANLSPANVFQVRCPNINDVNAGPSTGIGYVPPPEDPGCAHATPDCYLWKLVAFVDKWAGWAGFVGDAAGILMAGQAAIDGDWDKAASGILSLFTSKGLEAGVKAGTKGVLDSGGRPRYKMIEGSAPEGTMIGASVGAKLLCTDVPDDMKITGFCLF
jgi:hypothetical protein